ncbi:MAG: hypothetical protein V3573_08435 [Desulfovibrionaceae bacterium]
MSITNSTYLPNVFCLEITGFRPHIRVEFKNGVLVCARDFDPADRNIAPTPEQWLCFWRECEAIGVWAWEECYDSEWCDGYGWSIKMEYSGHLLESWGNNNYPGVVPFPMESQGREWPRFIRAVERLLGGLSLT